MTEMGHFRSCLLIRIGTCGASKVAAFCELPYLLLLHAALVVSSSSGQGCRCQKRNIRPQSVRLRNGAAERPVGDAAAQIEWSLDRVTDDHETLTLETARSAKGVNQSRCNRQASLRLDPHVLAGWIDLKEDVASLGCDDEIEGAVD